MEIPPRLTTSTDRNYSLGRPPKGGTNWHESDESTETVLRNCLGVRIRPTHWEPHWMYPNTVPVGPACYRKVQKAIAINEQDRKEEMNQQHLVGPQLVL